jgi:Raf kinase inhibitor-like YbhB/YbcL family protein
MITLRSDAFENGQSIPEKYSGEGEGKSPPLAWEGAPGNVREFAIVLEDIDAPGDRPWIHWLVWQIPNDRTSLPEGDGSLFRQGRNGSGEAGYSGPMPPPGHGVHHYHFRIYALDKSLELEAGAGSNDLLDAMEGHVLDTGELVGTYERP